MNLAILPVGMRKSVIGSLAIAAAFVVHAGKVIEPEKLVDSWSVIYARLPVQIRF